MASRHVGEWVSVATKGDLAAFWDHAEVLLQDCAGYHLSALTIAIHHGLHAQAEGSFGLSIIKKEQARFACQSEVVGRIRGDNSKCPSGAVTGIADAAICVNIQESSVRLGAA